MSKTFFLVEYPDEQDLFKKHSDWFDEKEIGIVKGLIEGLHLREVHEGSHLVDNDIISPKGWRLKYNLG